ncbi:unnamed protein product, partial [Meganyctiphanes norvegica]
VVRLPVSGGTYPTLHVKTSCSGYKYEPFGSNVFEGRSRSLGIPHEIGEHPSGPGVHFPSSPHWVVRSPVSGGTYPPLQYKISCSGYKNEPSDSNVFKGRSSSTGIPHDTGKHPSGPGCQFPSAPHWVVRLPVSGGTYPSLHSKTICSGYKNESFGSNVFEGRSGS